MSAKKHSTSAGVTRRTLCKLGLVSGIAVPAAALGQPADRLRPQQGDQLVFDEGANTGELITPKLLELHAQPVAALARDPQSGMLRDGSRLNRIMIMRLEVDKLSTDSKANAADGIVAFSAICTHTGCDVSNWDEGQLRMRCPCHESEFDVYNGGKVVGGPAPQPLAMLPLEITGGVVTVAGAFKGRVGFQQAF